MASACGETTVGIQSGTVPYMDTVRCCDCLDGLRDLPDGCIDLVVTDPPYAYASNRGGGCFGSDKKAYHSELEPISHGFAKEVNEELLRVMAKSNIYIWCSRDQVRDTLDWWLDNADVGMDILTWHKTNPVPTCHNKYLSDTEYLLFFRGKGVKVHGTYETKRKFLVSGVNKADKDLYNHPTVKPYGMTRDLIVNSSLRGGSYWIHSPVRGPRWRPQRNSEGTGSGSRYRPCMQRPQQRGSPPQGSRKGSNPSQRVWSAGHEQCIR